MNDASHKSPRRRGRAVILAGAMAVVFAGLAVFVANRDYRIIVTQEAIDRELERRFPMTERLLLVLPVTLTDPQFALLPEDNRIRLGFRLTVPIELRNQERSIGTAFTMVSHLRYQASTRQLFMRQPVLERLDVEGLPPDMAESVKASVHAAVKRQAELPLYTVRATGIKTLLARLLLKEIQVRDQQIHVVLGL